MNIIAMYETMLSHSESMVLAAREGNWDQLTEQEAQVAALRERLRISEPAGDAAWTSLSPEWRAHKAEMIERILENDRIVRTYAEPWMESLRQLIAGKHMARRVKSAYSAHAR